MKNLLFTGIFLLGLCSCSFTPDSEKLINVEEMKRVTSVLSSDEFLGRKPFTLGENLTVAFLAQELQQIGFEPPFEGSYFQAVPMVETISKVEGPVTVSIKGEKLSFNAPDEIAVNSPAQQESISISNSKMVFAGFGIDSPDDKWDDFKGIDLKGKTLVVLINDPGLYSSDTTLFRGKEMTFFGRWTYKFEEAARKGAEAILIIHESLGAGYEFNVPRNSSISSRLFIDDNDATKRCKATGWLSESSADRIFSKLGYNVKELRMAATKRDFQPFEMDAAFSVDIKNKISRNISTNVAGIMKGTKRPDEAIVITAHWDHFGVGEVQNGDSIYNGSVDNGTTMAWAFEIGRAFSKAGRKPERSVILLFPTAEEQGLVGSEYYTEHPIIPMYKTIACLNNDMMVPRGRMNDVTMIGFGYSSLDSLYDIVAKKQGRYLLPDPNSHTGLFFRSDHFPFFKKGVPSLWAFGCYDSREHGKEWAVDSWNKFIKSVYHTPADNYDPNWDWSGIAEDTRMAFEVSWMLSRTKTAKPRFY